MRTATTPTAGAPDSSRARRLIACHFCRAKKVRCDGNQPCANCVEHDQSCAFASRRRIRPRSTNSVNNMAERLARVEALVQGFDQPVQNTGVSTPGHTIDPEQCLSIEVMAPLPPDAPHGAASLSRDQPPSSVEHRYPEQPLMVLEPSPAAAHPKDGERTAIDHPSSYVTPSPRSSLPRVRRDVQALGSPMVAEALGHHSVTSSGAMDQSATVFAENGSALETTDSPEINSVYYGEMSNGEYHGPRSFLSICSKPGIQWVTERSHGIAFKEPAYHFTRYITGRLKIERNLSGGRTPEPSPEDAWKYTFAYFEGAREAAFQIVDRGWFEATLQSHFNDPRTNDDCDWYALRNAIYASGARIKLSKTTSFRDAGPTGWDFFCNCLSVHTELLYFRTSLMGVQALTIMGYYSEAIGNPCLEFMLSTISLRLAISKGFHRQAIPSWNMSRLEQDSRSRIFWAAYCLEKNSAGRSGRPSMISDDDITCELPSCDGQSGPASPVFFTALIKLAQLTSSSTRKISKIETRQQSPGALLEILSALESQLAELKNFLQQFVDLKSPLDHDHSGTNLTMQQAIYIRMAYNIAVFNVHTVLTYPWYRRLLSRDMIDNPELPIRIRHSESVVVEAARNMILATQFLRLDASTSLLVAFHGPIWALINMFIHVLQNPSSPVVSSDLALMDIGTAHFSRLELATDSDLSFPFARDLTRLARAAVDHSRAAPKLPEYEGNVPDSLHRTRQGPATKEVDRIVEASDHAGTFPDGQFPDHFFELELEQCSTFLPVPGLGDSLAQFIDL